MKMKFTVLPVHWIDIIPYFEAPFFLVSNFKEWKRLLWYDFFVYIPNIGTMPSMDLSVDYSNFNWLEFDKISEALLNICDIEQIINYLESPCRDDVNIFMLEWGKYIKNLSSNAIVGYEFIYE